jgi:DNA-binding transcriptional LysR family regulator
MSWGFPFFGDQSGELKSTRAGEVFLSAAREISLRLKQASAAALHAESGEVGTIRLGFIPTANFHILPRLLEKIRSTLPLVNAELREGTEDPQITGLRTGSLDVCIGHLSRTYDQIENMLLIREPLVLALTSQAPMAGREIRLAVPKTTSNDYLRGNCCAS